MYVPVIGRNAQLQGIVTDRDIVTRNIANGKDPKTEKVRDIMTTNVSTVSPDADVNDVTRQMAEKQVRRVPVVENGNLVGMATLGDIAVTGDFKTEISTALCDICEGCDCK